VRPLLLVVHANLEHAPDSRGVAPVGEVHSEVVAGCRVPHALPGVAAPREAALEALDHGQVGGGAGEGSG